MELRIVQCRPVMSDKSRNYFVQLKIDGIWVDEPRGNYRTYFSSQSAAEDYIKRRFINTTAKDDEVVKTYTLPR